MSKGVIYAIVAVIAAFVVHAILPTWLFWIIVAALVIVPVGGYLMLDPGQRRRLKGIEKRKRLGR